MPVVCAIGINYTQHDQKPGNALTQYSNGLVSRNTGSNSATACVIAAYNRNAVKGRKIHITYHLEVDRAVADTMTFVK
jgi:hypothetical protein